MTTRCVGWHKQYLSDAWDAVAYDGWKGGQSLLSVAQKADSLRMA